MVTGSNYLLEIGDKKILIDCGMYQTTRFSDEKNYEKFPYNPRDIEAVFVTHAHLDHTGRLPKLKRDGFGGEIYSSEPTRDFAELMLLDSEHVLLQESEKTGSPVLYTAGDVLNTMSAWRGIPYHKRLEFKNFAVTFYDAGHILGSSFILIEAEGKRLVFSGDLGNTPAPIIMPTEHIKNVDYCIIESTYGGRVHESGVKRKDFIQAVIKETMLDGGVLMIPAFAMERTQELLFELDELVEAKRIPKVPIFIDSPLAIKLTAVYQKYENYFNKETANLIKSGDQIFNFSGLHMTLSAEQSKDINNVPPPKIIVAGSGMSQGGRILHHEIRYLGDPKNTILFVGYQASGSLGRQIFDGQKMVKIFNEDVIVRAKVKSIGSYSAHADQPKLLNWLEPMHANLKKIFIVHGEVEQSLALSESIKEHLHIHSEIPKLGASYDII